MQRLGWSFAVLVVLGCVACSKRPVTEKTAAPAVRWWAMRAAAAAAPAARPLDRMAVQPRAMAANGGGLRRGFERRRNRGLERRRCSRGIKRRRDGRKHGAQAAAQAPAEVAVRAAVGVQADRRARAAAAAAARARALARSVCSSSTHAGAPATRSGFRPAAIATSR